MSTPVKSESLPGSSTDDDNLDFLTYMQEATQTDLSDVERTGCVSLGKDLKNHPLIIMIPSMAFNTNQVNPELVFRRMLLLFLLKANEMVGTAYSVVYAHSSYDIMSQYPLIYRFYSILPRSYKKNLQRMYIIHPNVGIRMFFEFARIFLSTKFYSKLALYESILDFQRVIPPTLLQLPFKFLKKEDEELGLKYFNIMPALLDTYDPAIGTMRALEVCIDYLRTHKGTEKQGIFRIPGDESELQAVKIRLQYAYSRRESLSVSELNRARICLSENKSIILVGDIDALYDLHDNTTLSSNPTVANSSNTGLITRKKSKSALNTGPSTPTASQPSSNTGSIRISSIPEEVPMSIISISNVNTVAQILKMVIRELPEALVPESVFVEVVDMTRRYDMNNLSADWEVAVAHKLSTMPIEHLSTFTHVIEFIREVCTYSSTNNMDAHNLSIVFAPTIFRSGVTDPIRAVMEVKLSQVLLEQIILRPFVLSRAIEKFGESGAGKTAPSLKPPSLATKGSIQDSPVLSAYLSRHPPPPISVSLPPAPPPRPMSMRPGMALGAADKAASEPADVFGEGDLEGLTQHMNAKMLDRLKVGGSRGGDRSGGGVGSTWDRRGGGYRNSRRGGGGGDGRESSGSQGDMEKLEEDLMERASFILNSDK